MSAMKTKESWLHNIFTTNAASGEKGYEMVRAIHAQDSTLAQQIVKELVQHQEPYYQKLGLYGITLLASTSWESLVLKIAQHANPEIKNNALRALGFVGTQASMATLLASARQDYDGAVWALKKLVSKFPEYTPPIFDLAKDLLLSEKALVREQATAIIVKLMKVKEAETALLKSAEMFADEFALNALKEASAAVLPRLQRLKKRFSMDGAEYQDIERTINAIAAKQQTLVAETV